MASMRYLTLILLIVLLPLAAYAATITSTASGYWNDTGTWLGGTIPSSTDSVVISSSHTVLFDRNDTATTCGTIEIKGGGALKIDSTPSTQKTMQVKGDINVYGKLELVPGSTLKLECESNGQFGIIVFSGGELKGTGSVPTVLTTLAVPLAIGGQIITVADGSGFGVGDIITLGDGANAEGFTISSISGTAITLNRKALNAQISGAEVYKNATVTTSNISAGSKTFTVANLGGIKAGDRIAVATTVTRYYGDDQTELRTVETTASNLITVTQFFSYSHDSGVMVVKTNRDTSITSAMQDGKHNGYFLAKTGSSVNLNYVQLNYLGKTNYNNWLDIDYLGVTLQASSALMRGCSVSKNYYGVLLGNGNNFTKLVSNVFYRNISGIEMQETPKTSVLSNISIGNDAWGLEVYYSAKNSVMAFNWLISNGAGNVIYACDSLAIFNNEFSNGGFGGMLAGGSNTIYSNDYSSKNNIAFYLYGGQNVCMINILGAMNEVGVNLSHSVQNYKIVDSDFSDDFTIQNGDGGNLKIKLMNTRIGSFKGLLSSGSQILSYKHNNEKGKSCLWGDYHVLSSEIQQFNYINQSYPSSATVPILFRGSNHTIATPETSDAATTTEVWFVTYRTATSNWEVKGTVSGLQSARASSGVPYTSDNGQVKFTLTQNSPQEGDQFVFATIAAAGDANTQKKILFGPSAIAELNNQSRLTVDLGGKLEMVGTTEYPTLVDYDGTGSYGLVISGEVKAQYFDINQINSDGVKIDPTATITKFDNGTIRNVSGLGPHLEVNGKNQTFNYLNFDNTGAFDVKASNSANLVFAKSQRGKFLDSIVDTSSISWDEPILGYTNNYLVGAIAYDATTKKITIPFKIKEPNSLNCAFKSGSFQYSQNGGTTWHTVADSDLSGTGGSFASSTSFASAPEETIYWNTGTNYSNLEANLAVRFRVNNGYVYGDYGTSEAIPFNLKPPVVKVVYPTGGESINAENKITIFWNATDEGSGVANNSISLYYSTGESWQLIANNLANTGNYSWQPPLGNYNNVKIKATVSDNVGLTAEAISNVFSLYVSPPAVKVVYPTGGESINAEKNITVSWFATDEGSGLADNSIGLYYTTGEGWQTITASLPNTGNYSWQPPLGNYNNVKVKATVSDNVGLTAEAASVGSFKLYLSPPTVQVLSPNGGELFKGGAAKAITWLATDEGSGIADNSIDVYYNDGIQDVLIAKDRPNTGSYNWTIPTIDSKQLKIKIRARDNVGQNGEDISNSVFEIDSIPPAEPMVNPVKSPTVLSSQLLSGEKSTDTKYIYVNGSKEAAAYPNNASWNCLVNLAKGKNAFKLYAQDAAGNNSAQIATTIEAGDLTFTNGPSPEKIVFPIGSVTKEVQSAYFYREGLPGAPMRGAKAAEKALKIEAYADDYSVIEDTAAAVQIILPIPSGAANPRVYFWNAGQKKWLFIAAAAKNGQLTFTSNKLGTFAVFDVVDIKGPTISNLKINNLKVVRNDSIPDRPEVSVEIVDDYGLDASAAALSVDSKALTSKASSIRVFEPQKNSGVVSSGILKYVETNPLSLGEHTFTFTASDEVGNSSSFSETLYVVGATVSGLMVYPNPYASGGTLKFDGLAGDVNVYLYDAGGDLVWQGATSGAASISWEGKNHAGNVVAPGVYFYVVRDASGNKSTGKIAVIK